MLSSDDIAVSLVNPIYNLISARMPEVVVYESPFAAMDDFGAWADRCGKVSLILWYHQLPIARPLSYWAQYRLAQSDYRLNIRRRFYGGSVHHYDELPSSLPGRLTAELYREIWARASRSDETSNLGRHDRIADELWQRYPARMELLLDMLYHEEPTCQEAIESFVLLAPFQWLIEEARFHSIAHRDYQIPVNTDYCDCLRRIIEHDLFLFTFSKLCIVTRVLKA